MTCAFPSWRASHPRTPERHGCLYSPPPPPPHPTVCVVVAAAADASFSLSCQDLSVCPGTGAFLVPPSSGARACLPVSPEAGSGAAGRAGGKAPQLRWALLSALEDTAPPTRLPPSGPLIQPSVRVTALDPGRVSVSYSFGLSPWRGQVVSSGRLGQAKGCPHLGPRPSWAPAGGPRTDLWAA